ncbi:MAG: hypothetical protein ACOX5Z_01850 [Desulfobulbus sp.]|jgi:hypothetical protein
MYSKIIDKKTMLAAILTTGLTFAISQSALAVPDKGTALPPAPTADAVASEQPEVVAQQPVDCEILESREAFLDQTAPIRRQLAEKRAIMRAIMAAGTPDTMQAGKVAGEIFDLQEQLRVKARATGLPLPMLLWDDHDGIRHPSMPPPKRHYRSMDRWHRSR